MCTVGVSVITYGTKLVTKSKDMEPGREGGMWFGFAIKDLENGKGKKYCIAALLNVTGEKIEHGDGRGRIVKDYLTTNLSFDQYVKTLEEVNFSGFNFVGIEISKDDCQVYHYSNTPKIFSVYSGKETLGFGNSPTYTPLTKVTKGRYQFEEIISRGLNNEELVEELLKLLKNETKHLPDEELEKRNPAAYSLLSSIFVKIKDPGYGTRAHSILLIDYNWNFQFIEHALKQPIDIENPEWNINKIQSRL
ncbi:transport and Golgi organization protein 2 isoform X2 [Anoplophora glabripennis]|uniref:transport and Golgi organization protein 2 isoform X2 n=1 Tax=Anoplophora glabripennis TaxID=217634 RepID=UPI0008747BE4|nr:transport and Golgi organization protein 2 isoform X2 [Anoplophora glabripennis]